MWIDDNYIVPAQVVAVVPSGLKKKKGVVSSTGCEIWLTSGGILYSKLPSSQVVSMLNLYKYK
jgi:hypothetical protein